MSTPGIFFIGGILLGVLVGFLTGYIEGNGEGWGKCSKFYREHVLPMYISELKRRGK